MFRFFSLYRCVALALGFLSLCVWAPKAHAQQPEVFGLTVAPMPTSERVEGEVWLNPDRFYRELVRQAVLIVARHEFGLPTRDAVLREPLPEAGSPGLFEIDVTHGDREYLAYRLTRGGELIQEKQFHYFSGRASIPWSALTQSLQETGLSLKQALTEAGLEPVRRPFDPNGGGATAEMEDALNRMELVSQYTAVRLAHAAIREQGETRDLLVVLVRGYANLSQLTAFHADSARYAFAARALLYATRIPQMGAGYPMGYWVRAYASQLFGLTREAAWDLAQADAYVERNPEGPEPPAWVGLVRLASRYDFAGLRAAVDAGAGEHQELAALLWFRSAEFCGYDRVTFETGLRAWEHLPHCARMATGMSRSATGHRAEQMATLPFAMLNETVPASLALAAGLDPSLRDALGETPDGAGELAGRDALAQLLIDVTAEGADTAEPSLAVLGRMIQEQEFMLIVGLAEFIVFRAGGDAGEMLDAVAEIIEGHPHAVLLQALRAPTNPTYLREVLDAYEPTEGNPRTTLEMILANLPWNLRMPSGEQAKEFVRAQHLTCAMTDVEAVLRVTYDGDLQGSTARYLRWLNWYHPDLPFALSERIRYAGRDMEEEVEQWAKAHGLHPAVARRLAWRYAQAGRVDEAIACYETYRAAAPDYDAHFRLAKLHWDQGDHDRAAEIVRAFLDEEDYVLKHANLTMRLALNYMAEGRYDLAQPWAEHAGQSNAQWALRTLANCLEAQGRFDESREVFALADRQYGSEYSLWEPARTAYDVEATRRNVLAFYARRFGRESSEYARAEANWNIVAGDYASAIDYWANFESDRGVPFRNCLSAMLGLLSGDEDLFIEKLHAATLVRSSARDPQQDAYILLAGHLLSMHGGEEMTDEQLREVLQETAGNLDAVNNVFFFLALWYEHQGRMDLAIEYYKRCAAHTFREHRTVLRAYVRLNELGEDPAEVQVNWIGF